MAPRSLPITLSVLAVVATLAGCSRVENARPADSAAATQPREGAALAWKTDAAAALEQARTENKVMLMNFTGSDWCIWCQRLDGEVFSTPAFADYAREKLVLVKLDFPRGRSLPEAEQRQNNTLAERYGIEGFPTIVVLDASGKKIGELGYLPGGPTAWLAELRKITKS
jgi:thioredoxin-related protein